MSKNKSRRASNVTQYITEKSLMLVLLLVLVVCMVVLVLKENRGAELVDPITTEQPAG